MKEVKDEKLPEPMGAYSVVVISEIANLVFISGQLPVKNGKIFKGDFKEQVKIIMDNCKSILEAAGSSFDKVLKVTVYIKDISKFAEFNEVYATYFKKPYPARAVVEVSGLPKDTDIELEMIAER